jgi:hypothetical protein
VSDGSPQEPGDGREVYFFRCTACSSQLELCFRPSRINQTYHELLTDPGVLKARFEAVYTLDKERAGLEPQTGLKVLEALSSYLRDSIKPGKSVKRIPAHNKRFLLSLGEECSPLLIWLGFRKFEGEEPYW